MLSVASILWCVISTLPAFWVGCLRLAMGSDHETLHSSPTGNSKDTVLRNPYLVHTAIFGDSGSERRGMPRGLDRGVGCVRVFVWVVDSIMWAGGEPGGESYMYM